MWSIFFQILSPCSGSYCYNTNQCGTACIAGQASCTGATNYFCPRSQACVAASTVSTTPTCQTATNRYSGTRSYQVVREITYSIPSIGPRVYHLDPTVNPVMVGKGDIIGYTATTGRIATRGVSPNETLDLQVTACSPAPCTPPNLPGTGIAARHLLRATASKPTSVLFFHTFTNTER